MVAARVLVPFDCDLSQCVLAAEPQSESPLPAALTAGQLLTHRKTNEGSKP